MERATVIIGGADGPGGCVAAGDRAALELAIDRFPAKPHVYCVTRDETAFRYAAAVGAERVGLLSDLDAIEKVSKPGFVAEAASFGTEILRSWQAGSLPYDVFIRPLFAPPVLVGPASLSRYGDWLPAVLAERLAAALVFEVLNIVAADEDSQVAHANRNDGPRSTDFQSVPAHREFVTHGLEIRATGQLSSDVPLVVVRDLGHGERDELEVRGPAMLVISGNATPRRYVSRYRRRFALVSLRAAAADARGMVDPLNELGGEWGPIRPRVRAGVNARVTTLAIEDRVNTYCGVQTEGSSENEPGRPIQADAATCAAHLLRYLSHHGLLPDGVAVTVPRSATADLESVVEPRGPVVAGARRRGLDKGGAESDAGEPESASHESGAPDPHNAARARRPRLLEGNDGVRQRRQPRLLSPSSGSGGDCAMNGVASRTPVAMDSAFSACETTHDSPLSTQHSPLTPDDSPPTTPASRLLPRPDHTEGSAHDA